ncbi:hypothetical protein ONS95_005275 [Cadophora gregata]|uniref:uncharacterized protein n=1 Tax=Cadophora gregata TaxID=51156 RepID=UPI0026DB76B1|nr:uncharacterized protein ONS95_005275 [Cadophora gregata]KAK0103241.1 hypothetical protein ONS95_005275 [Cadophora gregata]KAK0107431.1 hypothetical protein ONS96_003248 [Cadophora gregata f. sp. sojae]
MATPTCSVCNSSNTKFCSTCRSSAYCSPACQKLDWPLHKTICKAFTSLPARPSPSHKLAILFPVDSKDPTLIWIECERRVDEDDGMAYEVPNTEAVLSVEDTDPKYKSGKEFKPIQRNALRGFDLSYTVQVICRDAFLIDGSTPNVCVRQTTKGEMTHDWRGPIVVLRQPGLGIDPLFYDDVRADDLRVAVDYFLYYGR